MKILLAIDSLIQADDISSWAYELAKQLSSDNMVSFFTFNQGDFVKKLDKWRVFSEFEFGGYDLVIARGKKCFKEFAEFVPPCRMYVIDNQEGYHPGADIVITTNDSILAENQEIEKQVIPDLIDTSRFLVKNPVSKKLSSILYLGGSKSFEYSVYQEACKELSIRLYALGGMRDMLKLYNQVDLVIGRGRQILEAMSCGRNVFVSQTSDIDYRQDFYNEQQKNIVFNHQLYGVGIVTETNFAQMQSDDFRGEYYQTTLDKEIIKMELAKFDPSLGARLRELVIKHYSAARNFKRYISLYKTWKLANPNQRKYRKYDPKKDAVQIRV